VQELLLASSTSKPFAFYRLTAGTDTEANLGDAEAIGFDYGINEDSVIGVVGFNVGVPQRPTDVPNVGERSTAHPATSLVSIPITIDIVINEKTQDNPKPIAKLLRWSIEDQTVRGTFSEGRFCLRNDKMAAFPNIIAVISGGIKFIDFNFTDEIEWSNHQTGQIKLEYVGAYTPWLVLLDAIIDAP
jgi:hypothetical protein